MSGELPATLKMATLWLLIGVAVFLSFQWWQREQTRLQFSAAGDIIEIRRGRDGHYHWPGSLNGRSVEFLVDTGATGTAIPAALAEELGLETIGRVQSSTAGGIVMGRVVRADLELRGGVKARHLRVVALPGLIDRPLLGMDVLGRLQWEQRNSVMRIDLRGAGAAPSAR